VPEYGTGCFVACGRRQGLLALDLGSIFEKLLHQKTFNLVTVSYINGILSLYPMPWRSSFGSLTKFIKIPFRGFW
jgi:hypothetical protein